MADIADILGVDQEQAVSVKEKKPKKQAKPDPYASLPRYLRDIVDENNPPPKDLFEEKKTLVISKEPAKKWIYDEFTSSARNDGATFRHWVRKNVEYPDYPFARFNIKINVITYTDEEYEDCIFDVPPNWTKALSDELFELCRKYDLRWPVIMDVFSAKQYSLEDCQIVFLEVTRTVLERRQRMGHVLTEEEENYIKYKYDYENSVRRRKQQDILFKSPGLSQQEEKQLQQKLKTIQEKLDLIGSPDSRRSYGPRYPIEQIITLLNDSLANTVSVNVHKGACLASQCFKEEVELARDMKEEYRRIVVELGLGNLPNLSYKSRYQLLITKRKLATLLLAKKCKAENELTPLPTQSVKRWNTMEVKVPSKKKK